MKRMKSALILLTVILFCCTGCANWLNETFGMLTSEISNFSVKMFGPEAVMISWDPIEGIDGYNIYLKENATGREALYLPLYQGTSYCIPAGEAFSFAVSVVKGNTENRTDFVSASRSQKLPVQTKTSYYSTDLVIPSADNVTNIYVAFDDSATAELVPPSLVLPLPQTSWELTSHYFRIIYVIGQNFRVESALYYYNSQNIQSEILPQW